MVRTADAKKGQSIANKCLACHTLQKGQPTRVGPNLYGVVGTPIIRPETGYNYSQAFQAKGKEGFTWTFDNLNHFLTDPRKFIPGTNMTFPGLPNEQDRADVVAYLRTLSDNPVPLPAAPAAGGAAPTAPANGTAPAAPAANGTAPAANGTAPQTAPAGTMAPAGGDTQNGSTAPTTPAQ